MLHREERVEVSIEDAQRLGIEDGDEVTLQSERASLTLPARVTDVGAERRGVRALAAVRRRRRYRPARMDGSEAAPATPRSACACAGAGGSVLISLVADAAAAGEAGLPRSPLCWPASRRPTRGWSSASHR
ncbi:MAG: molybdopterin dinucleotide binding domain-containing protein [Dehalococcoidia bacterium]